MKAFIRNVILYLKARVYSSLSHSLPAQSRQDIPYFSQWESRELNRQILSHDIKAEDDPNWRNSGAVSKAEYASWSWSGCGMACLKMILARRHEQIIPLVTLGKLSLAYDCYDLPLEASAGLKYAPFVRFLKQEFSIVTKVAPTLPSAQIVYELAHGNYVMASVSPMIRDPSSQPTTRGGHVVLIVGYDLGKRGFYLHNPSGDSPASQAFAYVSFDEFKKFFNGRGVVIAGKDKKK